MQQILSSEVSANVRFRPVADVEALRSTRQVKWNQALHSYRRESASLGFLLQLPLTANAAKFA